MNIIIGADHRGFELKNLLKAWLSQIGHSVEDVGPDQHDNNDDYPDLGFKVGEAVAASPDRVGIVVCGSGVGMAIAAGKVPGVRAALIHNFKMAEAAKRDDNINVLALGADFISLTDAQQVIAAWLETPFGNQERYIRRLQKISDYENSK